MGYAGGGRGRKPNHKGRSRRTAGADEIRERNEATPKKEGEESEDDSGDEDDDGGVSFSTKAPKREMDEGDKAIEAEGIAAPTGGGTGVSHVDKEGVQLSRKQREEIQQNQAKKRYEQLHKEGKTDEAKTDLSRLEEVKARREEARLKKEADAAAAKEKENAEKKDIGRSGMTNELKAALGGQETRMRGSRSQTKKKEKEATKDDKPAKKEDDFYVAYAVTKKEETKESTHTKGTIEACREAEDDFM